MIIISSSPLYNIFSFIVNYCFLRLSIPHLFLNFPGSRKCTFTVWRECCAAQDAHKSSAQSLRHLKSDPEHTLTAPLIFLSLRQSEQRSHFTFLFLSRSFRRSGRRISGFCYFRNLHIFAFTNSDKLLFCFRVYESVLVSVIATGR